MPRKPQSFHVSISLAQALEAREQRGAIGRFLNKNGAPKGVYIYGDVGRGKTMLMDLFFANLQVKAKQRVHFHAFMQDIHRRRQALREADVWRKSPRTWQNRRRFCASMKCRSATLPMR